MSDDYKAPGWNKSAYHCPHCGVLTDQRQIDLWKIDEDLPLRKAWVGGGKSTSLKQESGGQITKDDLKRFHKLRVHQCWNCSEYTVFWIDDENLQIYPKTTTAPHPHEEMPDDVERDFNEARLVVRDSPRAAAALLRLAIQRLLEHLDANGSTIHQQIGNLVENERVSPRIQKALDSVRTVGNESVHPGEMDMDDNRETATTLFKLVNAIVDETIGREQMIDDIYDSLPENKRKGIENRDT